MAGRRPIGFRPPSPGTARARPPKDEVQVHARPEHPGRVRGRDRHPPAVHDGHRAHGRRDRRRGLRAAGARASRSGRSSRRHKASWQDVGAVERLPDRHLRPQGHHDRRGHRRGGTLHRLRAQAQPADRHRQARPVQPLRRDLHALHAPRLPGALHAARRSASSALATAASTTSRARSAAARPSVRSTASTPASENGRVMLGPRYSVNRELRRFSPRDPGEPLDGIGQYAYPVAALDPQAQGHLIAGCRSSSCPSCPRRRSPTRSSRPRRARARPTAPAGRSRPAPRWGRPSSTGSTSARRCRAPRAG